MATDDSRDEKPTVSERRVSHMSIEDPLSPASNSSDSIYEEEAEEYEDDIRPNRLMPGLSRTVSTNSVGNVVPTLELQRTWTSRTSGTITDPAYEVDFEDEESGNPQNWPLWYKGVILAVMSYSTTAVVLFSTSYTSAIPGMIKAFGISDSVGILGVTTYLLGMAVGSVILAPLSEMYGRRPIYIAALGGFVVFVIPCAVAKNIATILVSRFFGAFCAAAMISNAPGTVNDIVDEEHRALAFSIWSIGPMNGPVIGPVVGGFVFQYLGWRWTNWVVIIGASVAWLMTSLIKETYAPALLRKRAAKKRKETGDDRWWSRYDDKLEFWPLLKMNLSRPFVMTVTEPIW
jgi:multidrug resistance protein